MVTCEEWMLRWVVVTACCLPENSSLQGILLPDYALQPDVDASMVSFWWLSHAVSLSFGCEAQMYPLEFTFPEPLDIESVLHSTACVRDLVLAKGLGWKRRVTCFKIFKLLTDASNKTPIVEPNICRNPLKSSKVPPSEIPNPKSHHQPPWPMVTNGDRSQSYRDRSWRRCEWLANWEGRPPLNRDDWDVLRLPFHWLNKKLDWMYLPVIRHYNTSDIDIIYNIHTYSYRYYIYSNPN